MIKIFDMCVKSLNNSNIEGLTNMIKVISILEFFDLDYQKAFSKIIPERTEIKGRISPTKETRNDSKVNSFNFWGEKLSTKPR